MKRFGPIFLWLSISAGTALGVCAAGQAISIAPSPVPPDVIDPTISGARHQYVVTFDGEGEATVAAQFEQTNLAKEPVKLLSFAISGTSIKVLRVIQQYTIEKEEEYCKEYDRQGNCVIKDKRKVSETKYGIVTPQVKQAAKGLSVEIPFEAAIEPNKQSTVYVSYKVNGYTTEEPLGLFKYQFETAEFDHAIDSADVAVYVEPDLYLQGSGKGRTNYLPNLAEGIAGYTTGAPLSSPFESRFSSAISQDVAVSKQGVNLDPLETYTVKGAYARTWWRLYWSVIVLAIVGLAVFIGVIWIGERILEKKSKIKN